MTGIVRTVPQLLTEFPIGGPANGISPQQMQDLVSTMGQSDALGIGGGPAIAYAPTGGYAFGTLVASAPATLAAYFGSLAAAQVVFPFATATTNYADRCVLQLALDACTAAGGGIVLLPTGASLFLDATVTFDGSQTRLHGSNAGNAAFHTQTCGTNSPVTVNGGGGNNFGNSVVIKNISFIAVNASNGGAFPQGGGGVANTGYVAGSIALTVYSGCSGVFENLYFINYDTPHAWGGSNCFLLEWRNCAYGGCNYGPCIMTAMTNSFENMKWTGGGSTNNNYGFYFSILYNPSTPGSGSIFIENMSLDYNIVSQGYYDGAGTGADCIMPLFLTNNHIETDSNTSGTTNARFSFNGRAVLTANDIYENGSLPVGIIGVSSQYTSVSLLGNITAPWYIPMVYINNTFYCRVSGSGNVARDGSDVILLATQSGCVMSEPATNGVGRGSGFTLALFDQRTMQLVVGGGFTITIPPDSSVNHLVSTKIVFLTLDTGVYTFAAGAGVTLTSVSGNTFGGAVGKIVGLVKAAANTWIACGDMT